MYPKQHIIFGLIFSIIIFFIFPSIELTGFLIIFLSSVLIDVDHYLYYVYEKKDWNLRRAYKWFVEIDKKLRNISFEAKLKSKTIPVILHGIEFLGILIFLSFFSKIFFFIFLGVIFHMVFDYISIIYNHDPLYVKFSQIYIAIRNRNTFHNK